MPLVRTLAFVLRAYDFGDSSRIFRVYTPVAGAQSFLARGVKQVRSRLRGVLDLFNLVELTYYKKPGRTLHLPRDADLLESYPRMKRDLDRMLAFAGVARLLQRLAMEEEANPELFEFLTRAAAAFDHPDLSPEGVEPLRHYAAWQVLARKGYAPQLDRCVRCGSDIGRAPAFGVAEGGVLCTRCAAGRAPLSGREYGALRLFLHGNGDLAAGWRFAASEGRRLDRIREDFTAYHTGIVRPASTVSFHP